MHFTEGSYARIAVKLFTTLDVDIFYVREICRMLSLSDPERNDSSNMIRIVREISYR